MLTAVLAWASDALAQSSPLSPQALAALEVVLQAEYWLEASYQGVVNDFGAMAPFDGILRAEQGHSAAIVRLFRTRGLSVPARRWRVGNVPHFGDLRDACVASARAERENVALYDRLLFRDLPDDVRRVFTSNRRDSSGGHALAFDACAWGLADGFPGPGGGGDRGRGRSSRVGGMT